MTASLDGTLRIWDLPLHPGTLGNWIELAERHSPFAVDSGLLVPHPGPRHRANPSPRPRRFPGLPPRHPAVPIAVEPSAERSEDHVSAGKPAVGSAPPPPDVG